VLKELRSLYIKIKIIKSVKTTLTEAKLSRTVRRGRIFPEIQWTTEQKARRKKQLEVFHHRCKAVFEKIQPELIKTHYNWYMVVEPDSGDYFIDSNEEIVMQMARQKYPGTVPLFLFRINETGASGTI
jgi:hypothetical protein